MESFYYFLAVLSAGILAVVLGMVWYAPPVLGNMWMKAAGVDPKRVESEQKKMPLRAFIAFVFALVLAWVTMHFAAAWGVTSFLGAFELGFWIWLGFMVPVHLSPVLWEQKSLKYFAINAGYWLVVTLVIATIVSLWK